MQIVGSVYMRHSLRQITLWPCSIGRTTTAWESFSAQTYLLNSRWNCVNAEYQLNKKQEALACVAARQHRSINASRKHERLERSEKVMSIDAVLVKFCGRHEIEKTILIMRVQSGEIERYSFGPLDVIRMQQPYFQS